MKRHTRHHIKPEITISQLTQTQRNHSSIASKVNNRKTPIVINTKRCPKPVVIQQISGIMPFQGSAPLNENGYKSISKATIHHTTN